MSVFLAGHDAMEFGWCISTWIPALRYESQKYDKTVVIADPAHEYLYKDFVDKFIGIKVHGNSDRWLRSAKIHKPPGKYIKRYKPDLIWWPNKKRCLSTSKKTFRYGYKLPQNNVIAIHARSLDRYNTKYRNYSVKKYKKIVSYFQDKRYLIVSVGKKSGAYYIPGTIDKRGVDLEYLCAILYSSSVCIGTSSGVMHLASYCGCPHVVFTDNKIQKSIRATNRTRYKKLWNPLKTKCVILDKHNWQPPVSEVIKATERLL